MQSICDKNCFVCPYHDCIRDERQDERDKQRKHYHANIESKREYHRNYAREHYDTKRNTENCRNCRNVEKKREYDRERYLRLKAEKVN